MITVNEHKIKLYDMDSVISLKDRVAVSFNSLPKFLDIEGFKTETIKPNAEFKMKDFLIEIETKDIELKDLYTYAKNYTDLDMKEAIKLWICKNNVSPFKHTTSDTLDLITYSFITELETNYESFHIDDPIHDLKAYFMVFVSDVNKYLEKINNDIRYLKEIVEINDRILDTFMSTENIASSKIRDENIKMKATLNLENIHILEIFNAFKSNKSTPFASCKEYFKILKNYKPETSWNISYEDKILLKMNSLINETEEKEYLDVLISFENNKYDIKLQLILSANYLKIEDFKKRLFSVFPSLPMNFSKIETSSIVSVFILPDFYYNSYTFLDMIMNDRTFSNLMYTDERTKLTKRVKNNDLDQYWIHIHFEHPSTGKISASMLMKTVDPSDMDIRLSELKFNLNDIITKVKVKGDSEASINNFKNILTKICTIYKEKAEKINDFYREFIPDFANQINIRGKVQRRSKEKIMASEVFIAGHARQCQHKPSLLDPDEVNEHKGNVMLFPRNKQASPPHYEGDGVNQQYYTCKDEKYKYIGVKLNKLKNKDKYPYLPCCFASDQKSSEKMKQYYDNVSIYKEYKQQNLITTDKILQAGGLSDSLPEELKVFFQTIDSSSKYVRIGVSRSPSSVIECLTTALGIPSSNNFVKIRKQLCENSRFQLTRQSTFEMSDEELIKKISDESIYLDPKYVYRVFEELFKCNIFIFNESELVCPFYVKNFIRNKYRSKNVFIIEHFGAEGDHAEYPQCEIIARVLTMSSVIKSFSNEDIIAIEIQKIFDRMTRSYVLNKQVEYRDISLPPSVKPLFQDIDIYGKTRLLQCDLEGKEISILTEPVSPFALKVVKKDNVKANAAVINSVFKQFITGQTAINGVLKDIHVLLGNTRAIIPVSESVPLANIRIVSTTPSYSDEAVSYIDIYNRHKKNARYLTENMLWLFSNFIHENKLEMNDETIYAFSIQKFITKPNFVYDIPKNFSYSSGCFENSKLIIINDEMLRRLMYVLRLNVAQNSTKLKEYYTQKSIYDYYVDISDFDTMDNQILLQGNNSVLKLITQLEMEYNIHEEVVISNSTMPYFFKNNLISNEVYLVQNTNTLDEAIYIGLSWNKDGFNRSIYTPLNLSVLDYDFILYIYSLENKNIEKFEIKGVSKPETQLQIIGYKVHLDTRFSVMLKL